MSGAGIISKILIWRIKHISDKNFVLILSGLTGIVAGLAAVLLKSFVHYFGELIRHGIPFSNYFYLYLFFPLIGILLAYFISTYIFKERISHGVSSVLFFISKESSLMKKRNMISKMITSAVTVCFGGTVGLESPIVVTGSAIGSNIGRLAHLNYKRRTMLIGCGAAGAIAGIFNSPMAGMIFSAEVILAEVTIASFVPLLIAAVCASSISRIFLGDDILFTAKLTEGFHTSEIHYYLLLGILCGLVAVYFTRMNYSVEKLVKKINPPLIRAIIGGLIVGIFVVVFPPIYGEGYDSIKQLIANNGFMLLHSSLWMDEYTSLEVLILFLALLILVSAVTTALTIGSGGSGGIFAPSLLIGGLTGFAFTKLTSLVTDKELSVANFTLVGMCGVMSGVLHAPLTAIFLIAEITGGYTLFIPLMLVSAISFVTISAFEPHSLYTKKLIEKGDIYHNNKDRQVLAQIDINKLVQKDCMPINVDASLGDLVDLVKVSTRNIFPALDEDGKLKGIVLLDDIRQIMFDQDRFDKVFVKTLMTDVITTIQESEKMASVMNKFERSGKFNLPVVDADGRYIGFVSRAVVFNAYRHKVIRAQKE